MFGELEEAFRIVAEPEIELQVLGVVLDVLHVVHKVTDCAGLVLLEDAGNTKYRRHTGHVPPLIMRSNESASGIPADDREDPVITLSLRDFCFSSPLMLAWLRDTREGLR